MNRDRLDLPRVGLAAVVTAGLSLGLAYAWFRYAQSTPDVGPTAATLDEAFSALFGGVIGLTLGSALGAILVRRGSRLLAGLAAGLIAHVVVIAPVLIFTGASDATRGENIESAAYLIVPVGTFALLGGAIGRLIAPFFRRQPRQSPDASSSSSTS